MYKTIDLCAGIGGIRRGFEMTGRFQNVLSAEQDEFDNTIDFADNIVTLCPNCHRKIHYGLKEDKYEMIKLLYSKRKDLYPKYGIEITLRKLISYYII